MFQLGVAVRVLGRQGLRVAAKPGAHLSVGLLYLRELLQYLGSQQIHCYRLADTLAPCLEQGELALLQQQIDECADLLGELRSLAAAYQIRLTMHLSLQMALASPDHTIAERSATGIIGRALLLNALGGVASTLVLHVGGSYGDRATALERFAARFEQLPALVQAQIAVEPDEECFSLNDLLRLHQLVGIPVVFDTLHFQLHNPARIPLGVALGLALATWPAHIRPKIHYSTQRTEAHLLPAKGGQERRVIAPRPGQHADYLNPFEFIGFLEAARGQPPFDIMLEAKAADLALLRLRDDLRRSAPEALAHVW